MRFMLPESPRWLVQKGRSPKPTALSARSKRRSAARAKTCPRRASIPPSPSHRAHALAGDFPGHLLKRTLSDWAFWFCCFSTTYGLLTWLPTLYRTVFHLPVAEALKYGMITSLTGIVSALAVPSSSTRSAAAPGSPRRSSSAARRWLCGAVAPRAPRPIVIFVSSACSSCRRCRWRSISIPARSIRPASAPSAARSAAPGSAWPPWSGRTSSPICSPLYGLDGVRLFRRPRPHRRDRHLRLRRRDQGPDARGGIGGQELGFVVGYRLLF